MYFKSVWDGMYWGAYFWKIQSAPQLSVHGMYGTHKYSKKLLLLLLVVVVLLF